MSHSMFNRRWASVVLETLTRHAVNHICIAPGSRSAPLTLAAANNTKLICHTHFDERGLGHLALGLAKSTGQPVAIIVTSGTAVANLYPAVIEARLTGERLIILSADRPAELIDCGANQAIEQTALFAAHAAFLPLPRPTPDISARWLVSAIDALINQHPHGALHINCPFAEPLYGDESAAWKAWHDDLGEWWHGTTPWLSQQHSPSVSLQSDWPVWRQKRGVVVAGKLSPSEGVAVAQWAKKMGWPLLSDIQSQTGQPLPHAGLWLMQPAVADLLHGPDIVVQFGSHLVGKALTHWLAGCQPAQFWLIENMPGRRDPAHHQGRRLVSPVIPWLQAHQPDAQPVNWCPQLASCAADGVETQRQALKHQKGEISLARHLATLLPDDGALFLGNSLTVRLADTFAQLPAGYPVFANRGASGIDGLIATAAGIQRGRQKPVLAIVGDISALYDVNSLALLTQSVTPLVLIVVNNGGGQIFSTLPTPPEARQRFFTMPQQVDFAAIACAFGLQFYQATSWQALENTVKKGWYGGVTLIEFVTDADENAPGPMRAGREPRR